MPINEYWISDTHLGHEAIILKMGRGYFSSIEEHDGSIIEGINSTVGVRDRLWIQGDFAWHGKCQKYRGQIRCKNIGFVIGNHDKPEEIRKAFGGFFVDRLVRKFGPNGEPLVMYHYPIMFWDRCHRGGFHTYGHMHTNQEALMDFLFPERRSMEVSVDAAKQRFGVVKPFAKADILEHLGGRKGHDPIEYYESLNTYHAAARGGSLDLYLQQRPRQ